MVKVFNMYYYDHPPRFEVLAKAENTLGLLWQGLQQRLQVKEGRKPSVLFKAPEGDVVARYNLWDLMNPNYQNERVVLEALLSTIAADLYLTKNHEGMDIAYDQFPKISFSLVREDHPWEEGVKVVYKNRQPFQKGVRVGQEVVRKQVLQARFYTMGTSDELEMEKTLPLTLEFTIHRRTRRLKNVGATGHVLDVSLVALPGQKTPEVSESQILEKLVELVTGLNEVVA